MESVAELENLIDLLKKYREDGHTIDTLITVLENRLDAVNAE